jgi:hypothetical protein
LESVGSRKNYGGKMGDLKIGSGQSTGVVSSAAAVAEKPSTPEPQSAAVPETQNGIVDSGRMNMEMAFSGQAVAAGLHAAVGEKEGPKVTQNQQVDITSGQQARVDLLRSAPQMNPISKAAGNGPNLCGGASVANALILSSKTPEQAKANAKAVQNLAGALKPPLKMSGAEQQALKNFESGKISPQDAQHMQQVMYRMAQRMPIGGQSNPNLQGVSTSQVATTMAALRSHGAFQGSSVTMHCNRLSTGFDHWTTSVDGIHANSQGPNDKSIVHGGPPSELSKSNSSWQNEIWLNPNDTPPKMHVDYRSDQDHYKHAEIQADKYKEQESFIDLEDQLFKAKPKTFKE